eukprot:2112435-Heterocapsa_arctica.AAC.1
MDIPIAGPFGRNIVIHTFAKLASVRFPQSGPRATFTTNSNCLTIEPPTPAGVYLGCGHEVGVIKMGCVLARTVTYNMEDFLSSCVDRYLELAGP